MPHAGVITILFTDLVDSTGLIERLGDEDATAAMERHLSTLRRCLRAHGGREVKSTGDGVMAAFSSPYSALCCAVAMQRDVARLEGGETLRVGVSAGEPVAHGDDLHGAAVVVARRLCDAAAGGEVLVSDVVRSLIGRRPLPFQERGAAALKGLGAPVPVSVLRWREAEVPDATTAPLPAPALAIRVALVDDEDLVRRGLRLILETEEGVEVVGEAADGAAVPGLVSEVAPDIVLMDIRMPAVDGIEACRRLADHPRRPRVIVLTTFDNDENVYAALRAGASGFLLKSAPPDELMMAIRAVHRGDAMLQPSVTRRLIAEFAERPRPDQARTEAFSELTARELDILRLVTRGLSNAEIAAQLVISEATVKSHVASILMKLGLRDRVQVVVLAYESGLVRAGAG